MGATTGAATQTTRGSALPTRFLCEDVNRVRLRAVYAVRAVVTALDRLGQRSSDLS